MSYAILHLVIKLEKLIRSFCSTNTHQYFDANFRVSQFSYVRCKPTICCIIFNYQNALYIIFESLLLNHLPDYPAVVIIFFIHVESRSTTSNLSPVPFHAWSVLITILSLKRRSRYITIYIRITTRLCLIHFICCFEINLRSSGTMVVLKSLFTKRCVSVTSYDGQDQCYISKVYFSV